jgi:hypothetical protein
MSQTRYKLYAGSQHQITCGLVTTGVAVKNPHTTTHEHLYPLLSKVALDLVCAPASQAYTERVFSVCGDMTVGKRNRMTASLERRVFLRMNSKYL